MIKSLATREKQVIFSYLEPSLRVHLTVLIKHRAKKWPEWPPWTSPLKMRRINAIGKLYSIVDNGMIYFIASSLESQLKATLLLFWNNERLDAISVSADSQRQFWAIGEFPRSQYWKSARASALKGRLNRIVTTTGVSQMAKQTNKQNSTFFSSGWNT